MTPMDIQRLSVSDLLTLEAALRDELMRRGISRTANSFGGEIGEHLALRVYGGRLTPPGTASFDLIDAQDRRIQVKSRTLRPNVQRHFTLKDLNFDLAVCLRFDRNTNALVWAREFLPSDLEAMIFKHSNGFRLPTLRAFENGGDVTAEFRRAFEDLQSC